MIKPNVFEKVKNAKSERERKRSDLNAKISRMEAEKSKYEAIMEDSISREDIESYSSNKAKYTATADALEVYRTNLKQLDSSLFGEDQLDVIKDLQSELSKLESNKINKMLPMLEKIVLETEKELVTYRELAAIVEDVMKDGGFNGSPVVAYKLVNISRTVNNLLNSLKH